MAHGEATLAPTDVLTPALNIRALPFFADLGEDAADALIRAARMASFAKDSYLFRQDDPAERCYVLVRGSCRLSYLSIEGNQTVIHLANAGDEVGLIAALPGATYPVSAQAMQPCEALGWDGETFRAIMAQHPELALRALEVIAGRFVALQRRFHTLATERVERRIARALLRLANQAGRRVDEGVLIDLPLTRNDIAEMTGVTLHTASRVMSGWEARGIIASGRARVTVLQPHELVRIADDLPE